MGRAARAEVYAYNAVIASCQNGSCWELALFFFHGMEWPVCHLSASLRIPIANKWQPAFDKNGPINAFVFIRACDVRLQTPSSDNARMCLLHVKEDDVDAALLSSRV